METPINHSISRFGIKESHYLTGLKVLLLCGIISSLLYIAATILGALQWEGYSSFSQTVSELIAIDAPSAPLVVPLFVLYSLLIFAFGLGVWLSAGQMRNLRIAAILIVGKEVLGLIVTLFAPIHMRGIEGTWSDTVHAILTGVGVLLCMFPAIGFAATAFGKKFRIYSIVTMVLFLLFGILTGMKGSLLSANLPTPWMGVWERINVYGYMAWIIVFALSINSARLSPGFQSKRIMMVLFDIHAS